MGIEELVLKEIIKNIIKRINSRIFEEVKKTRPDIETALQKYLLKTARWCEFIEDFGLDKPKHIEGDSLALSIEPLARKFRAKNNEDKKEPRIQLRSAPLSKLGSLA